MQQSQDLSLEQGQIVFLKPGRVAVNHNANNHFLKILSTQASPKKRQSPSQQQPPDPTLKPAMMHHASPSI